MVSTITPIQEKRKIEQLINIPNLSKSLVMFIKILSYTANNSIKLFPVCFSYH